jgi:formiminoglutamase
MTFYHSNDHDYQWTGRLTPNPNEFIWQMVQSLDLNHIQMAKEHPAYALLGFACDTGVKRNLGRVGAALGPNAIRDAFAKLASPVKIQLFDAGNLEKIGNHLEKAQEELAHCVKRLLQYHYFPIVLGGGHETAWGHFLGLHQFFQDKDIAILNFDAHFDLRPFKSPNEPNSGTPFRQIQTLKQQHQQDFNYYCAGVQPFANSSSLFDFAKQHQVQYQSAEEINLKPHDLSFIDQIIARHEYIYTTICLDVFAAHIAPGVSAPQVLGIEPQFILAALKKLKQSGKVIALDIVELSPPYDIDHHTAKLAAHLLMTFLL